MCILFIAIEQHPDFPLIICANRDEFHQRPTQAMHAWHYPRILAGKDIQAGGTWLGLSPDKRFAALTNFRQLPLDEQPKKSRGELVLKALVSSQLNFAEKLTNTANQYHGYNLIYGSLNQVNQLVCYDSINNKLHTLTKGVHSICNGALDDIWPKMAHGKQLLIDAVSSNQPLSIEALFKLMTNNMQALPELLPETGLTKEWEQLLSAIFIKSPTYGTRATTIITKDNHNNVEIYDRNYALSGEIILQQNFRLSEAFS
ncbi:NRDE family protein [Litorilituus lipolyticus]|uniref:NRDE family protein n=1 Tax=Litorilituus lipolyticus TaxID=2491017 RepID=A0A502L301_9GAMM|nr:NRDE family protein [Litorilituus lipolyticus]TPH18106.1 NRDE family protein [Litorilituus lipolyticus]